MTAHEFSLEPDLPALPRFLEWVQACCIAEGIPDELAFKLTLALEEAATNILEHAFNGLPPPHRLTVRLDITERLVAAEIADNGVPFDPTEAPAPDLSLPIEERDIGGLGIHLMRSLMDRVHYRRSNGANILRLEKARG